ncbi:hypothetical protein [uncultured Thiodictyon sp.]|jgi:hypothetical protein|uniref:hypothetical protein n=1 Tax=uncultured Thiodictyon sp. TaxID=1846217 RepID=UPI0025FC2B0F|nr:hypothetical protein [uncultured Thiodictyon sp.]
MSNDRFYGQPWLVLALCHLLSAGTHLAVAQDRTLVDQSPRTEPAEPQATTAPAPEQADSTTSETDQGRKSPVAPAAKPASTGLCDGS